MKRSAPMRDRISQRSLRVAQTIGALLLQLVGSWVVGMGVGQVANATVLAHPAPPAPRYVLEELGCASCPGNVRFRAASIESHVGSTLFAIDGTWPAEIATIPADVRLVANDVEVVLHPSADGFQIAKGTKGTAALARGSIAVGLRGGALLLSIASDELAAPLRFEFGLWKDGKYLGRLPQAGALEWQGRGAPRRVD